MFSEAILGNISLPPQFMGSALGFIHWQKVPAVMHFIFTNTLLKRVSQIYEVLYVLVQGLNLSFHLPLFILKKG